jgi:hypothetical protein
MMQLRWLVLYRTEEGPAAKIIIDGEFSFPFGVSEDMVGEDCEKIIAIVSLPDDYEPHDVLVFNREIEVQLPEDEEE